MRSHLLAVAAIALLFCGQGCLPERICWSADGRQALVLADALYVTDANGKLDRLAEATPRFVCWLADSKRFLAVGETTMNEWPRVQRALPAETKAEIISLAERFRSEILSSSEKDLGKMASARGLPAHVLEMMKMYLADQHAQELKPRLGARWKEFQGAKVAGGRITMARVGGGRWKAVQEVLEYPGGILHASVSPDGKLLAFTTEGLTKDDVFDVSAAGFRLHVRLLTQGQAQTGLRVLETRASWQFDWSPDSRWLLYSASAGAAAGGRNVQLGTVRKHRVASEAGELAEPPGQIEEVAAVAFSPFARLRWLPDGRIIFASEHVELPATAGSLPTESALFVIHPGNAAVVSRLLPDSAYRTLPDLLAMFRLSPDAQWASVPGSKGEMGMVELKTGRTQSPVPKAWLPENRYMPPAPPTWRSAGELCLIVPPGSPLGSAKRPEVVLYGVDGKHVCISKAWPDNVISSLMKE